MKRIPTYIINLEKRSDRKVHVLEQFNNKPEFNVQIIQAVEHEIGAIGLWKTIKHILQNLSNEKDDFVLICEDDHRFKDNYSKEILLKAIQEALDHDADILSGGVSWLNSALQVSENTYWVEKFTGLQFTIIFRKFFNHIIGADFETTDVADYKISSLSNQKFFMYPFISAQKEFGYSDVTSKNNVEGRVEELFNKSSESVQIINRVTEYFVQQEKWIIEDAASDFFEDITIPTYIISLSQCSKRLEHIKKQFLGKPEFDVNIVDAITSTTNYEVFGSWLTIRKVIEMASTNDDDVIIICEDTHEFTSYYSKQFLLQNIMGAYHEGADILLGCTSDFGITVPISKNRLWLGAFSGTQFLIFYKSIFPKILGGTIDENKTIDGVLSELTSNKIVLCPFISYQKAFAHPTGKMITNSEIASEKRLLMIQKVYSHHAQLDQNYTINKI